MCFRNRKHFLHSKWAFMLDLEVPTFILRAISLSCAWPKPSDNGSEPAASSCCCSPGTRIEPQNFQRGFTYLVGSKNRGHVTRSRSWSCHIVQQVSSDTGIRYLTYLTSLLTFFSLVIAHCTIHARRSHHESFDYSKLVLDPSQKWS